MMVDDGGGLPFSCCLLAKPMRWCVLQQWRRGVWWWWWWLTV